MQIDRRPVRALEVNLGKVIDRNGVLQFDIRFDGVRLRESSRLKNNAANRKACQAKLTQIEAEIALGCFDPRSHFPNSRSLKEHFVDSSQAESAKNAVPNFGNFAETWFAEKRIEWRRSYADTIRVSLNRYLIPTFGPSQLDAISKADILEFRTSLSRQPGIGKGTTLSASRINHILTPLRMILMEAADRFGFAFPWQNIKRLKEPRTQVQPFSLDEVWHIIRRVRTDFRSYYCTRFFTGLRSSEIDGLKWQHVDFDKRQILVREALVQGRLVPTKTDGSLRDVDMNTLVFDALRQQTTVSRESSDFVFCARNGAPLTNRNVSKRIWYPLLRRLGLAARRPYQTRHTAATLWLASGESPEWIARQMGHATTEMLFRVYSRYVPNLTRKDGSAFEHLLATKFPDGNLDFQRGINGY